MKNAEIRPRMNYQIVVLIALNSKQFWCYENVDWIAENMKKYWLDTRRKKTTKKTAGMDNDNFLSSAESKLGEGDRRIDESGENGLNEMLMQ